MDLSDDKVGGTQIQAVQILDSKSDTYRSPATLSRFSAPEQEGMFERAGRRRGGGSTCCAAHGMAELEPAAAVGSVVDGAEEAVDASAVDGCVRYFHRPPCKAAALQPRAGGGWVPVYMLTRAAGGPARGHAPRAGPGGQRHARCGADGYQWMFAERPRPHPQAHFHAPGNGHFARATACCSPASPRGALARQKRGACAGWVTDGAHGVRMGMCSKRAPRARAGFGVHPADICCVSFAGRRGAEA